MVDGTIQRIARLKSLHAVLARIDALVGAVAPREVTLAAAVGRVLARDAIVALRPAMALALRDGWAVNSALTHDAGPYAPVLLPSVNRIDAGAPLPEGTDAVAELDAVVVHDGGLHVVAPMTTGDGVLPAGADTPGGAMRQAGEPLSAAAAASLAGAGIVRVHIREPRLRVVPTRSHDGVIAAATALVTHAIATAGGVALRQDTPLETALLSEDADAVIAIGGTGTGRADASVSALARLGRVEAHGIALSPGETAAFGCVGARPVLLLPGRLDAALAVWLLLGQHLMARLATRNAKTSGVTVRLTRKVASHLGLAEFVPVRLRGEEAEPFAGRYLPLQTIARADGWFLVPADREGYPEGTPVLVRPLP